MVVVAIFELFVLLACAGVNSKPTDEYAPIAYLDYFGQWCPSSCEEAEARAAGCPCDSECERYAAIGKAELYWRREESAATDRAPVPQHPSRLQDAATPAGGVLDDFSVS